MRARKARACRFAARGAVQSRSEKTETTQVPIADGRMVNRLAPDVAPEKRLKPRKPALNARQGWTTARKSFDPDLADRHLRYGTVLRTTSTCSE